MVSDGGVALRREAERAGRPVLYLSLAESTSPHDMFLNLTSGLFPAARLGVVGTLAQSMGTYWIILFDIVLGKDAAHTREVNFSMLLSQLRHALILHRDSTEGAARPLILLDHLQVPLSVAASRTDREGEAMRAMLAKLAAWSAATSFDHALADVVLVGAPPASRGWWGARGSSFGSV
eukprot:CAMPEP_0180299812 /NCGR_PEP_ID=MMETSP0988-20121125/22405_1 /TAXON_ID=697907 /ORGANISM="non described non described, Strain CCMP2293" /LENGTH=177 /DNA_ID=CAMNT_0022279829 /DNA_START=230 /DNA_END=759 /DNA_ORIENTATION=-